MIHRGRPAVILALAVGFVVGCTVPAAEPGLWQVGAPVTVRTMALFQDPDLTESSGVAASRSHAGILWTHNDSGHPATLFATDTSGARLGRWTIPGAGSVDWEDIALGPCPRGSCLYIGDIGDNGERRASVTIYRIPEPDPGSAGGATAAPDSLVVTYPDRPRDVEALFVDDAGAVWLVSKGRSEGIFLYRLPAEAWNAGTATAERVDSLPLPHDFPAGKVVTGAAIAPDQRTVIVRSYRDLYFFLRDPRGVLIPAPPPNRCDILGVEVQGEAVDWWDESTLVLTSEGEGGDRGSVRLVRCGVKAAR